MTPTKNTTLPLSRIFHLPAIWLTHLRQKFIYSSLFRSHNCSIDSVSWSSRETQECRFRVFTQIGDLHHKRVLDIGCGLGDFYAYLKKQGVETVFTGYDIVPQFIDEATRLYPEARFETRDLILKPNPDLFDCVFLSGTFAFGNRIFFEQMIKASFEKCQNALGFNIHETPNKSFFKLSKIDAITYCKTLKPSKIILHDNYLPNDYTIFLYK